MIEKVTAFKASDGAIFNSIELVQRHEIITILAAVKCNDGTIAEAVAECLVAHKADIIDILTTGPRSHPKARKVNGGKRTRNNSPSNKPIPANTPEAQAA